MKTARTHTHTGNCQVCGRPQAVDVKDGTLAKHGYTIEWRMFEGTCPGSHELPLQVSRKITDSVIASALRQADEQQTYLDLLNTLGVPDRENVEGFIRHVRGFARDLGALANKLHGTALVPAEVAERAKSERKGARAAASAKRDELYQLKAAFESALRELQEVYLALPYDETNEFRRGNKAQLDVYYSHPYPSQWSAKKRAAVLAAWPGNAQVAAIVDTLDSLATQVQELK